MILRGFSFWQEKMTNYLYKLAHNYFANTFRHLRCQTKPYFSFAASCCKTEDQSINIVENPLGFE